MLRLESHFGPARVYPGRLQTSRATTGLRWSARDQALSGVIGITTETRRHGESRNGRKHVARSAGLPYSFRSLFLFLPPWPPGSPPCLRASVVHSLAEPEPASSSRHRRAGPSSLLSRQESRATRFHRTSKFERLIRYGPYGTGDGRRAAQVAGPSRTVLWLEPPACPRTRCHFAPAPPDRRRR